MPCRRVSKGVRAPFVQGVGLEDRPAEASVRGPGRSGGLDAGLGDPVVEQLLLDGVDVEVGGGA